MNQSENEISKTCSYFVIIFIIQTLLLKLTLLIC